MLAQAGKIYFTICLTHQMFHYCLPITSDAPHSPQREEDAIFVEESAVLEEEMPDQDADDEEEEDGDDGGSPWNDLG